MAAPVWVWPSAGPAELMGGTLDVSSREGVGSVFVFTAWFDMAQGRRSSPRWCPRPAGQAGAGGGRQPHRAQHSDKYLVDMKLEATALCSGRRLQVVRAADSHKPYDLALIDWRMNGGMDGVETAIRLKPPRTLCTSRRWCCSPAPASQRLCPNVCGRRADQARGSSALYDCLVGLFTRQPSHRSPLLPASANTALGFRVLSPRTTSICKSPWSF